MMQKYGFLGGRGCLERSPGKRGGIISEDKGKPKWNGVFSAHALGDEGH